MPDWLGIVLVLVLVMANGFFVATEFSIVAVRRSRLDQLAAEGNATAAAARDIVGHLDAYIAACQLGITMASLALGWAGEPAIAHLFEPLLAAVMGEAASAASHGIAVAIAFTLITALHIVVGELAPKGLALQAPEGTVLWITRPLKVFYVVFKLPILALNSIGNGVLRLFGLEPASGHEMVHSVEELRLLVTGMQQAGVVEASEARIATRAFHFGEITAAELMTPRTEVDAVPVTSTLPELLAHARGARHSRVIVYGQSLDDVLGAVHVRELFRLVGALPDAFDLAALVKPLPVVPASKHADEVLEDLRAVGRHLALVVDEFGGTAGIITLTDLLEALVGRISDEVDLDRQTVIPTTTMAQDEVVMEGLTRLEEFEETFRVRLAAEVHEAVDTVGGLIMDQLGRIPAVGDEVEVNGVSLRVEEMDGRRVESVRARLLASPEPATVALVE